MAPSGAAEHSHSKNRRLFLPVLSMLNNHCIARECSRDNSEVAPCASADA